MELSIPIYQSLNCYTPVLTTNCYPNKDIIKEGENGWLLDCKLESNKKFELLKVTVSNLVYYKKIVNILIYKNKPYN